MKPWRISGIPFARETFLCRHQLQSGRRHVVPYIERLSRLAKVPSAVIPAPDCECFRRLR